MPKPSTGTVRILKNDAGEPQWHAKFSRADGSRTEWTPIDPSIPLDDVAGAKACAARMAPKVRQASAENAAGPVTVRVFAKRWIEHRTALGIASVKENDRRLRLHVLPELGDLDVTKVTRDRLDAFVEKLDRRQTGGGEYDWRTAIHIWGDVRKMFSDASKKRGLRVRDDNPALNVEPPRRGVTKAKQYLYPSEALALLRCEDVPRLWKRLFVVSTYLYCRPEELEPLEWKDVDLEHGTVHIHRAIDRVRDKGRIKETKTGTARRVPIHPRLLPLLESMHEGTDGKGRVFPQMPPPSALARRLRRFLKLAGVTRADLYTTDATRRQITWYHATRSTGITWEIVAGTDPMKVMQRAGHERFDTTLIYVREAENLTAGFGEPFPTLPAAVLGIDPESPRTIPTGTIRPKTRAVVVGATGFEGSAENAPKAENLAANSIAAPAESSTLATVHDLSARAETAPGTEAGDPVEGALSVAVDAIARRLADAPAADVAGLVERLTTLAAELTARRAARETKTPARVLTLDGRRPKR